MLFDWLKTQKKPPRTNQVLAVLPTKFKKMAMDLILYAKEHGKKFVFLSSILGSKISLVGAFPLLICIRVESLTSSIAMSLRKNAFLHTK